MKYLRSLNPYMQMVIARVWAGCPMTLAHRKTIDPSIDATCPCGGADQTIEHLLFSCDLLPEVPGLDSLKDLSPSFTRALIFSKHLPREMVGIWRDACKKIIEALSFRALNMQEPESLEKRLWSHNSKGHLCVLDVTRTYAFCTLCFVSRRTRDIKYLYSRTCPNPENLPTMEGDYAIVERHVARLTMSQWRRSAFRPKFLCVLCGVSWWAPSRPPGACVLG